MDGAIPMESPNPKLEPEHLLEHLGWARALARGLVGDPAEADDVVQDAVVAALRHPPASDRPLRPWLGRVLGNAARMRARARGRRARRELAAAREEALPSTAELSARAEAQRLLIEELMQLDETQRAIVLLRYYEELPSAEIGRRLGLPAGTVRWRLKTALDELRERLDRRFERERGAWSLALAPLLAPRAQVAAGGLSGILTWSLVMKVALWGAAASAALVLAVLSLAALGLVDLRWIGAPPREVVQFRPLEQPAEAAPAPGAAGERAAVAAAASTFEERARAATEDELVLRLRFLDVEGRPVEGVELSASPSRRTEPALSGADGRAELRLPSVRRPFSPALRFRRAGYASDALEVTLREGGVCELGDVVLRPGGALTGRVVDQDGAPLAGAEVSVEGLGIETPASGGMVMVRPSALGAAETQSDEEGRFRLDGLLAGDVVVRAERDDELYSGESGRVEIRAGAETHGLVVIAERAAEDRIIAGIVLDPAGEPVPRAHLTFRYRSVWGSGSGSRLAGDDGRFALVTSSGAAHDVAAVDLGHRYGEARAEEVEAGARGLVLRLREKEPLELVLVDPHGAPIEGGEAIALDADEPERVGAEAEATERSGLLRLTLPARGFRLIVAAEGHERVDLGPLDPAEIRARAEPLRVVLRRLPGIRGVVRADGAPLAGARVGVQLACEERTSVDGFPVTAEPLREVEAETDEEGRFALTVREPARLFVRAEHERFAPAELGPFGYEPARGLDALALELGAGGAIEGRVHPARDAHGLLLSPAGVVVGLSRGDGHARSTRTDGNGRYRFERLQPGRWLVTRLEEELDEQSYSVQRDSRATHGELPWSCVVRAGETTRFDLVPPADDTCVVRGRFAIDGAPAGGWRARLRGVDVDGLEREQEERSVELEPDGSFTLSAAQCGAQVLTLEQPDGDAPVFLRELELAPGDNAVRLELQSARLALEGLPADERPTAPMALYWELGEWRAAWPVTPRSSGRLEIAPVPAGPGSLRRLDGSPSTDPRDWPAVLVFELRPGEARALRLP